MLPGRDEVLACVGLTGMPMGALSKVRFAPED
jgi:hypothetical protein